MGIRVRQDLGQIQDQQSPHDFNLTILQLREHNVIDMCILDDRASFLKAPGPQHQNVQQQFAQIQIWRLDERVVEVDEIEVRLMYKYVLKREIAVAVSDWY